MQSLLLLSFTVLAAEFWVQSVISDVEYDRVCCDSFDHDGILCLLVICRYLPIAHDSMELEYIRICNFKLFFRVVLH